MNNYLKYYSHNGVNFIRTRKDVAMRKLSAAPDLRFFLVGSDVIPAHFHSGWHCATPIRDMGELAIWGCECGIDTPEKRRALLVRHWNAFNFYLVPELGRYPVYYVEAKRKAAK